MERYFAYPMNPRDSQNSEFFNSISKWTDIDLGKDLRSFLEDIDYNELHFYDELLRLKAKIAASLINHIKPDSSSLPAIFELSIAFAKDLQKQNEYQDFFWKFFDTFIEVLSDGKLEPATQEIGVKILAELCDLNIAYISKEFRKIFMGLFKLFVSSEFMREKSAQEFAFLWRKAPIRKITLFLLNKTLNSGKNNLQAALSSLFFNALKNGQYRFQENVGEILQGIFDAILEIDNTDLHEFSVELFSNVMRKCVHHTNAQKSAEFTTHLLDHLSKSIKSEAPNEKSSKILCKWLLIWVHERNGSVFTQGSSLIELLGEWKFLHEDPQNQYFQLLSATISTYYGSIDLQLVQSIVQKVLNKYQERKTNGQLQIIFNFFKNLQNLPIFDIWCMDLIGRTVGAILPKMKEATEDEYFEFLRQVLGFYSSVICSRSPILEQCPENRMPFFEVKYHKEIRDIVVEILRKQRAFPLDIFEAALIVWPWLWRSGEKPEAVNEVTEFAMNGIRNADGKASEEQLRHIWLAIYSTILCEK